MLSYKPISYMEIRRAISIIRLYNGLDEYLIRKLAERIADILNSKIVLSKIFYFPSDNNNHKDFTYIGILSTSHLAISSYSEDNFVYIDIDVVWCSNKDISPEDLANIFREILGKRLDKILVIKIYNYCGDMMKAFSPE